MLPLEIYTLVLLASNVFANPKPQRFPSANSTTTPIPLGNTVSLSAPLVEHDESTETGFEKKTTQTVRLGIESTETGWETGGPPRSTPDVVHRPPIVTVTTDKPIVIDISTYIETPRPSGGPDNPGGGGSPGPEDNHNNPGGGDAHTESMSAVPQVTPGGDLLNEIISHIGSPQPGAQPTHQPAIPTGGNQESVSGFEGPQATSLSGGSPLPIGEAITLEGATLTLTPGLSTTVGSGEEATAVVITTNAAGQTIIVVSSSGTAVSATVTRTAVTITTKTGFDAEITDIAKPGEIENSSEGTATSSSSTAGAAHVRRREADWWLGVLIGIGALI